MENENGNVDKDKSFPLKSFPQPPVQCPQRYLLSRGVEGIKSCSDM